MAQVVERRLRQPRRREVSLQLVRQPGPVQRAAAAIRKDQVEVAPLCGLHALEALLLAVLL
ncbi:MAG: hypothetical protein O2895_01690 [Chloroflexi bacterium]|nr:hypothetical protein [Chloroflexota bacterium]